MASKSKRAKAVQATKSAAQPSRDMKLARYLIAIPLLVFIIKMAILANIPGGGWLGADGENYLAGVDGLVKSGLYSLEPKLSYWPAGYPILMWPIALISVSKFFYIVNIIQSLFYAFASYYFVNQLRQSGLKYLAVAAALIIGFNPTLSLSSLAIGYEAPIAAALAMMAGLIMKIHGTPVDRRFWARVASVGGWFALTSFMQPRFLLIGAVVFLIWALTFAPRRLAIKVLALALAVMVIAPAILIFRNSGAIHKATISTNLGVTMRIGAGDTTGGGYRRSGPEVPCPPKAPATSVSDNQVVLCVVKWYLTHPIRTVELAYNKSQYFWSPWTGPEANGTMNRNPWRKIAPTVDMQKNPAGANLVAGPVGKLISYLWIIGQMLFLFLGYASLRKIGAKERLAANILLVPVVLSWLIGIGTIGDHRFRIPTMTLSLVLQVAGMYAIKRRIIKAL